MKRLLCLFAILLSALAFGQSAPGMTKTATDLLIKQRMKSLYGPRVIAPTTTVDYSSIMSTAASTSIPGTTYTVGANTTLDKRIRCYSELNWVNSTYIMGRTITLGGGGSEAMVLEWDTDAPRMEVREVAVASGNGGVRYFVDGQLVSNGSTTIQTDVGATTLFRTFNWGSRQRRRIRMENWNTGFRDIRVTIQDTIWRPSYPERPRALIIGDSFARGSGAAATTVFESYAWETCRRLGLEPIVLAAGGTGYLADNTGTRATFIQRLTSDAVPFARNPSIIIIGSAYNDVGLTAATVRTAMDTCHAYIQSKYPGVPVVVWGPATSVAVQWNAANTITTEGNLKASARAKSFYYVDPIAGQAFDTSGNLKLDMGTAWVKGTGHVGATNNSGNADVLVCAADTDHPSNDGHQVIGALLAQAIASAMDLPVWSAYMASDLVTLSSMRRDRFSLAALAAIDDRRRLVIR